jgi:hypothetical protein
MIRPGKPSTGPYDDIIHQVMSQQGDDSVTDWMLGRHDVTSDVPLTREILRQNIPAQTHTPINDTAKAMMEEFLRRTQQQGWNPSVPDPQWPKWPE